MCSNAPVIDQVEKVGTVIYKTIYASDLDVNELYALCDYISDLYDDAMNLHDFC
jgi:hypothetical protein